MSLPKIVWVGVAIAVVVVVLVGVVAVLGLASLGFDSGGGGTRTVTETIFPTGFTRNYSGISSHVQGYHILVGGTYWGNYTVTLVTVV
ncbi:MAG: hypothetical protein ACYCPN_01065 [Thermoplasmata archaeon]